MADDKLPFWIDFGEEIAKRRRVIGKRQGILLTQTEVAKAVGITQKQLSRIENAISGTDYGTVERIAAVLEYDEDDKKRLFALAGMAYPKKQTEERRQVRPDYDGKNLISVPATGEYNSHDIPPDLQYTYGLHGRVLNALPPGRQRDAYIAGLRAQAEANWEMIRGTVESDD